MALSATYHIRRMRGGTQSQLMRASDDNFYVVKFQNNPQHLRALANEWIVTRLAEAVGLPVPAGEIIQVDDWLVNGTTELYIELANFTVTCKPGLQYGSRYAVSPVEGQVVDWMPQSQIHRVRNVEAFAGMLALDKWLCNTDARQSVFWRRDREQTYSALFIDHGYCFNNAEWNFPDAPLHGAYRWNEVYAGVKGWESFEPWLSQIEQMDEAKILASRDGMPPEWYGADGDALNQLLSRIVKRRSRVRELIQDFRDSSRKPFPGWAVRHYLTSVIL